MKQEDKELLFKDICARLPYKVKVSYYDDETERQECDVVDSIYEDTQEIGVEQWCLKIDKFKPYLFPLSSMTDEQRKELEELGLGFYVTCQDIDDDGYMWDEKVFQIIPCTETDDWMNAHHFDYRGLIEKSLALDATNLNIY
jgi:hypothetical protein